MAHLLRQVEYALQALGLSVVDQRVVALVLGVVQCEHQRHGVREQVQRRERAVEIRRVVDVVVVSLQHLRR